MNKFNLQYKKKQQGTVNNKQDDAIRNITGSIIPHTGNGYIYMASAGGAFSTIGDGANYLNQSTFASTLRRGLGFSANNGGGKGTATDSDGGIRPYNISMIPIIIVS